MHARKVMLHQLLSSFIFVRMMHSSTSLKKEISTLAVLMTQLGSDENCDEL
ncbi:hypothetical protein JIN86_18965 [Lysinibacillus sp. HST-98]|uniref:hypothetical protein n=1 Tax=Lysinibacillus sp. HST-98 TaxID=2800419 RepID=UPI001926335E|nr:hypothetical protein [Lysinibacillus sp. HST-98]MBL3731672.1 hypothetical protein [Lysinibacillus sp. HST-98]